MPRHPKPRPVGHLKLSKTGEFDLVHVRVDSGIRKKMAKAAEKSGQSVSEWSCSLVEAALEPRDQLGHADSESQSENL